MKLISVFNGKGIWGGFFKGKTAIKVQNGSMTLLNDPHAAEMAVYLIKRICSATDKIEIEYLRRRLHFEHNIEI